MDILNFLLANWHNILVVLAMLVGLYFLIMEFVKQTSIAWENTTAFEKIKYVATLLANLTPIALVLVTDAEIEFGGGTGPIKRSWVLSRLYEYIPDEFKTYVNEADLSEIVELVLEQAKVLWESNESVASLLVNPN